MEEEKRILCFTSYLFKDKVKNFDDCFKNAKLLKKAGLKPEIHTDGMIYYENSKKSQFKWKQYLDEISEDEIDLYDNVSNKAVVVFKIRDRHMAITFGFGSSLLDDNKIERNFGLKVALNSIDVMKLRSINATQIEDTVLRTQRQASTNTTQDQFGIDISNDIMRSITGVPKNETLGRHMTGKDSLNVSVFTCFKEIKDKLELYLDMYNRDDYKKNNFEWVDNIVEVKDKTKIEELKNILVENIKLKNFKNINISPTDTIDWSEVIGFNIKSNSQIDENDFCIDIDVEEYLEKLSLSKNILDKMKREKIYCLRSDSNIIQLCSVYNGITYQIDKDNKCYILYSGQWYEVLKTFYDRITKGINDRVVISSLSLPKRYNKETEGKYNERISASNKDFCLMDKLMTSVDGSTKSIEACDIFTRNKQFIHVKVERLSAKLSHLFAQGKISATCFFEDETFRKQVLDTSFVKFGENIFDYKNINANDFEVIFGIIDSHKMKSANELPFFSRVNLLSSIKEIEKMGFKTSICFIDED